MIIPRIELFEWLQSNLKRADFVLATSKMKGLSKREYDKLVGQGLDPDLDLGHGAQSGADEFKEALMNMYDCESGNIVTTAGGTAANFLVFLSFLDKDDEFIVEQPGYQPMWLTPEMLGARKVPWTRHFKDNFRLDVEALQALITDRTKLIVLTNPHNPSGVVADREKEIRKVAEFAHANGIYVLVDEIFLEGAFAPQISAYGLPNVIITGSMTKVYGLGGQRTGWIIASKEIVARCQHAKIHTTGSSSYIGEIMNARALRVAKKHLVQKFFDLSMTNYKVVSEWMEANQDIVEWAVPNSGIMCFPKYKVDMPSIELCHKLLDDHGVMVNPGEYFNLEGHIRLSYACSEDVLTSGLNALGKGLREIA